MNYSLFAIFIYRSSFIVVKTLKRWDNIMKSHSRIYCLNVSFQNTAIRHRITLVARLYDMPAQLAPNARMLMQSRQQDRSRVFGAKTRRLRQTLQLPESYLCSASTLP